ncbi:MAG: UMP kinase [Candidatus Nanohaloarchaeota archaeon]|nr:UMP kinase [Candidatus Nanohaloarchaeota archaeon]
MVLVISLGGSLITQNYSKLKDYADVIKKLAEKYEVVYVVTGGGKLARQLIEEGKKLGYGKEELDWIGIYATRIHALMMYFALGMKKQHIAENVDEIIKEKGNIKVMGGVVPGQSTDAVASEIAVKTSSPYLINATDVKGVYDKDPKKHKDAVFLKTLCYDEFIKMMQREEQEPGKYALFDLRGLNMLKNTNVILKIMDATNPYDLLDFEDKGTEVKRC